MDDVDKSDFVLDVISMCLAVDPAKRITTNELKTSIFNVEDLKSKKRVEAKKYMSTLDPLFLVQCKFTDPLVTNASALTPTVLSNIIEEISLYGITPVSNAAYDYETNHKSPHRRSR